jgi:hypothetical protein
MKFNIRIDFLPLAQPITICIELKNCTEFQLMALQANS